MHVLQNFAPRHGPWPWLQRVDSTSDSTYTYQAEFWRCQEEVTLRSRPIWKVGRIKPIISCISWVTGQKIYHNLTRCMTSHGFRGVPMRWYNINVQKKSLSWITFDYTAHLHTTERVRWEFQWTIFWCELPCVGSLTLCFWLEILWGWYWYWVFIGKNQAFNQTFRIYFAIFGSIRCKLSIILMLMLSSQPLKHFRISLVTGDQSWLQKKLQNRYSGCIQDVIHVTMWWFYFCRNTTSHENAVVNNGKYSNTRGRLCDWASSKTSGTHICCILLFSLCLFLTCHPFAIHRRIGSEDVFGKRTPWNTEEILPDGTISEMLAMAHGIPINYNSILKYILFLTTWKWINSVQVNWIFLGGMKLLQNRWKVQEQA